MSRGLQGKRTVTLNVRGPSTTGAITELIDKLDTNHGAHKADLVYNVGV